MDYVVHRAVGGWEVGKKISPLSAEAFKNYARAHNLGIREISDFAYPEGAEPPKVEPRLERKVPR